MATVNKQTAVHVTMYCITGLIVAAAIAVRIAAVNAERAQPVTSFPDEWTRKGKPVVVATALNQDMPIYEKCTLQCATTTSATGNVTADIRRTIAVAQPVYAQEGFPPCGHITRISDSIDPNTGMYSIDVTLTEPICSVGAPFIILIETDVLKQVLTVPAGVIDRVGDVQKVWIVRDGKAHSVQVKTGIQNGYGVVVTEGLNAGAEVVVRGQGLLQEGDKIHGVPEETCVPEDKDGLS